MMRGRWRMRVFVSRQRTIEEPCWRRERGRREEKEGELELKSEGGRVDDAQRCAQSSKSQQEKEMWKTRFIASA